MESIDGGILPLQPSLKYNSSPLRTALLKTHTNEDLDSLARQLNIVPSTSPSKTALLRTRFESPSATVSSFKTPSKLSNLAKSSANGSPVSRKFDIEPKERKDSTPFQNTPNLQSTDEPTWAKKNYKDVLNGSPKKNSSSNMTPSRARLSPMKMDTPSFTPKSRPYLSSPSNSTSKHSPGYEYLCRIQAIKDWLEKVLQEEISQGPADLISYIRNGIHLAKLANFILPRKRNVFTNDSKLQFKHTENINRFFHLLDYMNVPDLFRFELTDLYDAKNVPKVWFCLHAMSYMLNKTDASFPKIENLVDLLDFSDEEIRTANRALVGSGLPNFASADTGVNSSCDNTYMEKMVSSRNVSPMKQSIDSQNASISNLTRLIDVQPHSYSPTKVFVESAIQTDPFRETSVSIIQGFNVGSSTNLNAPAYKLSTPTPIQTIPEPAQPVRNQLYESSNKYLDYYTPELENHVSNIIKIQSLSRGANYRYSMFVDRIMLKSYGDELTYFASIIRGNSSRSKTVHRNRKQLLVFKDEIITLQSIARQRLLQTNNSRDFSTSNIEFSMLQNIIRGQTLRKQQKNLQMDLACHRPSIVNLQSLIRTKQVYSKSLIILKFKYVIQDSILDLQSIIRRRLFERHRTNKILGNLTNNDTVARLQAVVRGNEVREGIYKKRATICRYLTPLYELQSIARGGISRSKLCNNVLVTLIYEDIVLNQLYAKVRGNNIRTEISVKKAKLKRFEKSSILPIQSRFRGILSRFDKEIKLGDIYQDVESVIDLQSLIRGYNVRLNVSNIDIYYHQRILQVIKAQSVIKSRLTQSAYRSLISMRNAPLSVISRFAYLLTDNNSDYQEEMELSDAKDKIIQFSKSNEEIENQIENLDIKLSLLDKNKITIEEFIKHKNKYKTAAKTPMNVKHLERLNKSSRERIELYQSMFYFLQTKPIYFTRLYNSFSVEDKESKLCKDLQSFIVLLFPIQNSSITHHSREEYFYVKFILDMMKNDIQHNSQNISDLTKSQSGFWIEYLLHFNNHTYQRQHLKGILGKIVGHIVESDDLDFESNPSEIYYRIADRERKVNGYTEKSDDVPPQVAIKEPEVSSKFVENLMSLREFATDILNTLENSIEKIPLHMRLICNHAYELSQLQFPDRTDQQHLAVAGVIFIKHYIATILQYPENFGLLVKDPFNPVLFNVGAKDNLKHLSRVMLQVFSMKPFNDNFLKPLNEYVTSSIDMTRNIIVELINVKDLEKEYDLNDYNDIIADERPKLSMKVSTMILIEKCVCKNIDIMAPSSDDQLYSICTRLDDVVNSADDYVTLTELGTITLNLNPTSKEDSLADSKVSSLINQAKRCILYIMRIQEGEGLLELLISGIKPSDEERFKEIVCTESQESTSIEKRRPYYKTSLGDLTKVSYRDMKKMALEMLLQLESMGHLTRKNSFQEILNQIAIDIKTKDTQRSSRKKQLQIASLTVDKLTDKAKFLRRQLSDYNKHIESILAQLQLKPKDKKLFNIIPVFSKQYFYHRELRKRNRLPKFGSYKYAARKLMDQGVLGDFGGLVNKAYSSSSKLDFMFSCHEVGIFTIEAATGSVNIPGAYNKITLDQLLNYQYENQEKIELFDGMVIFNTHNLTALIFRKFYELKRD